MVIKENKLEAETVTEGKIEAEEETFELTAIVHTVDRETQKVRYSAVTKDKFEEIIQTVVMAFGTLAPNKSMTLATEDNALYIFNVENVTCVEIRR